MARRIKARLLIVSVVLSVESNALKKHICSSLRRLSLIHICTYITQTAIIETLAKEGPCIIVGRCGDYILRDDPDLIDVFLGASREDRISRIMDRYQIPRKEAASAVRHTDSQRRKYYENYTKQEWGSIESHQMLFNLSKLGVEKVVGVIAGIYKE